MFSLGKINLLKDNEVKDLLKKIIYIAYTPNHPIANIFLRTMAVFLSINIIFSLIFWYSFLSGSDIDFLNLNVPSDFPVKYFIDNTQVVFLFSASVAISLIIVQIFLEGKKIKEYVNKNRMFFEGPIQKIYTGEIKSFLLPKNSGYLRLWLVCLSLMITFLVLAYAAIPVMYYKFYNSTFYNMLANFQEQNISTLFYWNALTLIVYQIMTSFFLASFVLLVGLIEKKILIRDLNS